jgi:YHS domain-containing protein
MRRVVACVVGIVALAFVASGCGNCPMCKALGLNLGHCQDETTPEAAVPSTIAQKTCPVMGGTIDPKVYTDYQGRRVYFCCPSCAGKFQESPGKYLAKLKAQGAGE